MAKMSAPPVAAILLAQQNHRGQAVFHFEGVNSISEAETFAGSSSAAVRTARRLPAGQYFVSDLIGCSVFENPVSSPIVSSSPCSLAEAPSLLGAVRDVQFPEKTFLGRRLLELKHRTVKS